MIWTPEIIEEVSQALAEGKSYSAIARGLGISRNAVKQKIKHVRNGDPPSTWTEDRVQMLKRGIAEGQTYRAIAKEIGVSVNAVVGKVGRLKLAFVTRAVRKAAPKPHRARKSSPASFPRIRRKPSPRPSLEAPMPSARVSILDLNLFTCRWVMGDPKTPFEAIYCGGRTSDQGWGPKKEMPCPYCSWHAGMAVAKRN